MGKFPDPALHLRNKISDTHHQGSYCPRKLRNHTKHHQYNHANRKYDREEQAYRSCQFYDYLIFFFCPSKNFLFQKAHWHVGHKCDRSAKYKWKYDPPYCFQHFEYHIKLSQCDHKKCCKHNKFPDFFYRFLCDISLVFLPRRSYSKDSIVLQENPSWQRFTAAMHRCRRPLPFR